MILYTEEPYAEYEIYSYEISHREVPHDRGNGSVEIPIIEFDITISNDVPTTMFSAPSQMYIISEYHRFLLNRAAIVSVSYNSDYRTMDVTIRSDGGVTEGASPEWAKSFLREDSINKLLTEQSIDEII